MRSPARFRQTRWSRLTLLPAVPLLFVLTLLIDAMAQPGIPYSADGNTCVGHAVSLIRNLKDSFTGTVDGLDSPRFVLEAWKGPNGWYIPNPEMLIAFPGPPIPVATVTWVSYRSRGGIWSPIINYSVSDLSFEASWRRGATSVPPLLTAKDRLAICTAMAELSKHPAPFAPEIPPNFTTSILSGEGNLWSICWPAVANDLFVITLLVPLWKCRFALLGPLRRFWRRARPSKFIPGHCPRCGYDCRTTIEPLCPECGHDRSR
ncbi:hypothetical protein BH11PLA1_BH11PLA1_05990 [soil metagenome]